MSSPTTENPPRIIKKTTYVEAKGTSTNVIVVSDGIKNFENIKGISDLREKAQSILGLDKHAVLSIIYAQGHFGWPYMNNLCHIPKNIDGSDGIILKDGTEDKINAIAEAHHAYLKRALENPDMYRFTDELWQKFNNYQEMNGQTETEDESNSAEEVLDIERSMNSDNSNSNSINSYDSDNSSRVPADITNNSSSILNNEDESLLESPETHETPTTPPAAPETPETPETPTTPPASPPAVDTASTLPTSTNKPNSFLTRKFKKPYEKWQTRRRNNKNKEQREKALLDIYKSKKKVENGKEMPYTITDAIKIEALNTLINTIQETITTNTLTQDKSKQYISDIFPDINLTNATNTRKRVIINDAANIFLKMFPDGIDNFKAIVNKLKDNAYPRTQ